MPVYICGPSISSLIGFGLTDRQNVAYAISLLGDDQYRNKNKINLNLIEESHAIWALIVDNVWLGFCEDNGRVMVVQISLRSRFRI